MKIIDAHIHFSKSSALAQAALYSSGVDYSRKGYVQEAEACQVVHSVCMGLAQSEVLGNIADPAQENPMLVDLDEDLPPSISICMGINPYTLHKEGLDRMERIIQSRSDIAGIKIYAGYYHVLVTDPLYAPAYDLAEKHNLTVAIHSGDTYAESGLLKYSQPLEVDQLAVERRNINFLICHIGTPWIFDAAEVAFKNRNVFLDISGLLVGDRAYAERMGAAELLVDRYRSALVYLDTYEKILYGSDWPLVPMAPYIDFCKKLIPPEFHEQVFYQNALELYRIKEK
ncbi:MAG: amidohydrolase [Treponema sp.]|nr:amidohydrolase [Treponema sp.]